MGRGLELLESVLLVQHSEARRGQLGVLTQVQELLKPVSVRAIALLGRRARAELFKLVAHPLLLRFDAA